MAAPIGPYSPILRAGPWLVTSGQLGLEPATTPPTLVDGGAVAQLTQALGNGERLLAGEGAALDDVIKTTVFLTDMAEYAAVNDAYAQFFGDHRPTRSVVGVAALPLGARVEVELWAYRPS
ncbi:MAG TPA: Rid family hydrolase [Acidimicrobiales bacterium]|nr:Rid family hydrolase [Acidimicrobiales bacterium]